MTPRNRAPEPTQNPIAWTAGFRPPCRHTDSIGRRTPEAICHNVGHYIPVRIFVKKFREPRSLSSGVCGRIRGLQAVSGLGQGARGARPRDAHQFPFVEKLGNVPSVPAFSTVLVMPVRSKAWATRQHHRFSADSSTIELELVPNRWSQRPIGPFANPDHENCRPFFWIIRRYDR